MSLTPYNYPTLFPLCPPPHHRQHYYQHRPWVTKTPKPTLCHPYSLPLSLLTSKLSQNPPFSNSFYYFLSFPSPFFYFLSQPTTLIPATAPFHHAICTLTQARPKNTTFTALDSTLDNLGTMDFRLVSVCVWSGVDFVPLCTSNSSSEGDGGGKKKEGRREKQKGRKGKRWCRCSNVLDAYRYQRGVHFHPSRTPLHDIPTAPSCG